MLTRKRLEVIDRRTNQSEEVGASQLSKIRGSRRGVIANLLDSDIVINKFEPQSRYHVQIRTNILGKGMSSLIYLTTG